MDNYPKNHVSVKKEGKEKAFLGRKDYGFSNLTKKLPNAKMKLRKKNSC